MGFNSTESLHLWWITPFFLLFGRSCALNTDGALLLSFKYSVLSDPLSVLENWDYTDETPCSWTGITCAHIGPYTGTPEMFRVISLVLPKSQLLGSIPEDLGLLQHLRTLDLSNNFLNGSLPISIFNSSELQVVSLSNNMIFGGLPEFAGVPTGLQFLNLSDNDLAGMIPENFITSLKNLTVVSLESNYFSGNVPSGFDFVEFLDLSSNMFNGSLPVYFGGERLTYLNLSNNNLSGSLSSEFAQKIPANASIDLSFNNLTGEIPQSTALMNQKADSFAGNVDLCGMPLKKLCTVPSTLSVPPNVTSSTTTPAIAVIPKSIDSTPVIDSPNGVQNQQQSRLKPGTIVGITVGDLAGIGVLAVIFLYVYQLKKKRTVGGESKPSMTFDKDQVTGTNKEASKETKGHGVWSCLSLVNGGESSDATGSDSDENNPKNSRQGHVLVEYGREQEKVGTERTLVMVDGATELEVETLLRASAYVLGTSGSSIVYKAVLEDGTALAVRRIGECGIQRLRDFENRVRAVAKLRHPNVVRVRGFYWGDDEKLVIYDYVSNGCLASAAGYKKMGSSPSYLAFEVRLKIARGVARGLTYIHEKKHVHGNIKPSNILLTPDMEPVISDLGLDRLVSCDNHHRAGGASRHFGSKRSTASRDTCAQDNNLHHITSSSPFAAMTAGFVGCTSPYHAPESLENLKPNPKWDTYSFGIVLLELLTGRVYSDRELSQWNAGSLLEDKGRVLRMADVAIRGDVVLGREDALLACFKLGFGCASLVPQKRPPMKEALRVLEKLACSVAH